jgi:alpha-2-macroglobulin
LAISKKLYGSADDYMISRIRYYLYGTIDRGTVKNGFEKAYVLFSLSEGERVQKSMLDALIKSSSDDGTYSKILVALACINMSDDRGKTLFDQALKEYSDFKDKNEDWKNDRVETLSALLYASVKLGRNEASESLAYELVSLRNGIAWKNTRDSAWAVLALSEKIRKNRESGDSADLTVTVNGTVVQAVRVTAAEVNRGSTIVAIPSAQLSSGSNTILISKKGGGSVYAVALTQFIDRSQSFAAIQNGFDLSRKYYRVESTRTKSGMSLSLSETNKFNAGDLVMVELKLVRKGIGTDYVMAEDPLPAGFSVVRNDGEYYSSAYPQEFESKQAFDDRAVFFIRGPLDSRTIRYFIRADLPGTYRILPPNASRMYYPATNGSGRDAILSVGR